MRTGFHLALNILVVGLFSSGRAEINFGGMISFDSYLLYQDSNRVLYQQQSSSTGTNLYSSNRETAFNLPLLFNRIWGEYHSDDNIISAYFEIRAGEMHRNNDGQFWDLIYKGTDNRYEVAYAWLRWRPNDIFHLTAGRQPQAYSLLSPQQVVGFKYFHGLGNNFGNIYGGQGRDGVRADVYFNKVFRLAMMFIDPDTYRYGTNYEAPIRFNDKGESKEQNLFPRVDMALPVTMSSFRLEPSLTWLRQSYAHREIGSDNKFDIWGAALGAEVNVGRFSFNAEANLGQNLGDGNYSGAGEYYLSTRPYGSADYYKLHSVVYSSTDTLYDTLYKVANTDVISGWIDVGFKVKNVDPHIIFGLFRAQGDAMPVADTSRFLEGRKFEKKALQLMAGISVPILVMEKITITPEIMYYDWGGGSLSRTLMESYAGYTSGGVSARVPLSKENRGQELVAGIQTRFQF